MKEPHKLVNHVDVKIKKKWRANFFIETADNILSRMK